MVKRHIIGVLLLAVAASAGECPRRALLPGQAVDHACRLFRIVREADARYIETLHGQGWRRVERVDCAKAVPEGGVRVYHARTVEADFYCPAR